jgi:hypothetical protein
MMSTQGVLPGDIVWTLTGCETRSVCAASGSLCCKLDYVHSAVTADERVHSMGTWWAARRRRCVGGGRCQQSIRVRRSSALALLLKW